jgi:hypothetical protein
MLFFYSEAIANPRLREKEFWIRRIILDLLPQLSNIDPGVLGLFSVGRSPHLLENESMSQHSARIPDKQRKESMLSCSKFEYAFPFLDYAGGEIDRKAV